MPASYSRDLRTARANSVDAVSEHYQSVEQEIAESDEEAYAAKFEFEFELDRQAYEATFRENKFESEPSVYDWSDSSC